MSPVAEDGAFPLPRNSWYYHTAAASRCCYRCGSSIEAEGPSGVLRGARWSKPDDLEDGCRKGTEHCDYAKIGEREVRHARRDRTHAAHHLGRCVAGRGSLHDYGGFAGAQVNGLGRGRAGKGQVGDRASVCEGRNREPRTPIGFCPYGGAPLWIRSRSLLRVRVISSAFRARGCTRSLLRETPRGTG
jgi:hypothetical protein